jgi:hypothetical protein
MRILLLVAVAVLSVGCSTFLGGYSGEVTTEAAQPVASSGTFAIKAAQGSTISPTVEDALRRGLEHRGYVAAASASTAEIIAEYDFTIDGPKTRFKSRSNGFNNTTEMYTYTVYEKSLSLELSSASAGMIWQGELSSVDSKSSSDTVSNVYVAQLLSRLGKTVTEEDWFTPRNGADELVAKND